MASEHAVDLNALSADAVKDALSKLASDDHAPVDTLILNPVRLSLDWDTALAELLQSVLASVGAGLQTLDLDPGNSCNCVLPEAVSAAIVAHCTALTRLRLCEVPCSAATLAAMGGLQGLRELSLGGIAVSFRAPLPAPGLPALAQCTELRMLHLTDTKLTDEQLCAIARGCTRLEDVDLCGSELLMEAGVAELAARCAGLSRLELRQCTGVGPEAVRALAGCPALTDLDLQRVRGTASALSAVAAGCTALLTLRLASCHVLDADVLALRSLRSLTGLIA
jgi:hypothetical protein